jgi:glycosyltransferase involved in cell wall biosynthesis
MILFSKKLTVVTLFYNRAEVVEQTAKSLLSQNINSFDIVAVDDGSTDQTLVELNKFKANNFHVITHENIGFTRSLIEVLDTIDSEYIAIHGSGDTCNYDKLFRQVELLDHMPSVGFCGTSSVNLSPITGMVVDAQSYSREMLTASDFQFSPPFTHGSVMFRRSEYVRVGGYDERFLFSQDWDLWLRMLKVSEGHMVLESLYQRYVLPDGASFNPVKAEKQLIFKHLALLFDKNSERRNELLSGDVVVNSRLLFRKQLKSDLVNRLYKLILLGHMAHYTELKDYVFEIYGQPRSLLIRGSLRCLEVLVCIGLPIKRLNVFARAFIAHTRKKP